MTKLLKMMYVLIVIFLFGIVGVTVEAVTKTLSVDQRLDGILTTSEGGIYFEVHGFLYFFDYATETSVIVCGKTDCQHTKQNSYDATDNRCHAQLNGHLGYGAVIDDQLFVATTESSGHNLQVVKSNLDRSNQKVLANLPSGSLHGSGLGVYAEKLIMPYTEHQMVIPQGGGSITYAEKTQSHMVSLDPDNGEIIYLTDSFEAYSGGWMLLTASEHSLYLKYTAYSISQTDERFGPAYRIDAFYEFDIETNNLTQIDLGQPENANVVMLNLVGDDIYFVMYDKFQQMSNPHTHRPVALAKKAPDMDKAEVILENVIQVTAIDDAFYYRHENDHETHCLYDVVTKQESVISAGEAGAVNISGVTDDYLLLFLLDPDSPNSRYAFLRNQDFLDGNWDHLVGEVSFENG